MILISIGLALTTVACSALPSIQVYLEWPQLDSAASTPMAPTGERGDEGHAALAQAAVPSPIYLPPTVPPSPTPLPEAVLQQNLAEDQLLIHLYERVSPSVVSIQTTRATRSGFIHPPLPQGIPTPQLPFRESGEGSGFVIDTQGHIVTNHHVIADTSEVLVTFYEGTSVPATIVGSDPDSDLAVIKVNVPSESLRPVVWGDSDRVKVGQRAIAIGNPFGYENTLTVGIISGLSRSLPASTGYRIPEIIQTDTAINPGNSGGPLLNTQGEVIGVNTAIVPNINLFGERSFLGIGFAVPSNMAQRVVPELIAKGSYDHPWLGFWGTDVVPQIAAAMNLPEARGALVIEVVPNSPAANAGLRGGTREIEVLGRPVTIGGDVIIGIDDTAVRRFDDILVYLSRKGTVGRQVTLTIIRDGQTQTLSATLAKRPPQALQRD
ncbi:MAG: trypsin-like peptidase domain-containing protein [Anaerolineae bacterium]|nr:trypsin-like peptidase domain-containing protein [Anaerolineae bacterium]MDW8069851.1 trypsin-like peptidase domain-containing protein [Anaerolineae bacterium]